MNLQEIYYPVFKLPIVPFKDDDGKVYINDKLIDDTTLPFELLGVRRLHMDNLFKLKNAIYYLKDIIKITKGETWFIDSKGRTFKYAKSRIVDLVFKKITKVIPIPTGGALIEVDNNFNRFKVVFAPSPNEKYAGLLIFSPKVYVLYGLYDKQYKNTRRKI
jgi:hypothetical protein